MRTGVAKQKLKDKNVAIIRLKKLGERFEIQVQREKATLAMAAAKAAAAASATVTVPSGGGGGKKGGASSSAASSHHGIDFDDLLIVPTVFCNAAKSEVAKPQDIAKAFGEDTPIERVFLAILENGEMLQSQEDRAATTHITLQGLEALSSQVAAKTFVRPPKPTQRPERISAEIAERELKNARFKHSAGMTPE